MLTVDLYFRKSQSRILKGKWIKQISYSLCLVLVFGTAIAYSAESDLMETLHPAVKQAVAEFNQIPNDRTAVLKDAVLFLADRRHKQQPVTLTFICTHNSRRSHIAQLWCQAAAVYYGLTNITTYSGGTEVVACNPRTVRAMRRAGFSIVTLIPGTNAVYLAQYSENGTPVKLFSKLYNAEDNPKQDYVALFCCSQADASCPTVTGSIRRVSIPYTDPKLSDGSPQEKENYDKCSRQIAREMFFLMAQVRAKL